MDFPELYPFQRVGVDYLHACDGVCLLADDMGLGKTPQFLAYAKEAKLKPVLVVVPPSLRVNWEREALRFTGAKTLTLTGERPYGTAEELRRYDLVITGYSTLWAWAGLLSRVGFQLVGADEGHCIGSLTSRVSRYFRTLARGIPRRIIMTGTPVVNHPGELWGIISLLWPDEFESIYEFMLRYCEDAERQGSRVRWRGARNLPELNQRLTSLGMLRRKKTQVLKDLPPKRRYVIPMELSNRKEYERAERDFLGWLGSWNPGKVTSAARAIQFTRFSYMKMLTADLKLPALLDWQKTTLPGSGGKAIAFAVHRQTRPFTLPRIEKHFAGQCVGIHGGKSDKQKQEAIDAFQTDPSIRICAAQIRSGGVGLNLQAATLVAHYEFTWNAMLHNQATARAWRLGQTSAVDEYYFPAVGTIEEKLCEIIQRKQVYADTVLDGGKQSGGDGLYILDELTRAILGSRL